MLRTKPFKVDPPLMLCPALYNDLNPKCHSQTQRIYPPTHRVTETDKANEKLIFDAVRRSFPEDQLIGEESSAEAGSIASLTDAPTWIVDPVDGTTNFVHGFPMTCVSIAFGRGSKVGWRVFCKSEVLPRNCRIL